MLTKNLASVVLLNALTTFDGKRKLLAAGPLTKQPGTRPYRIILADLGDEFVVHTEVLQDDSPDLSEPITCGSFYETGDYFDAKQLGQAYKRFGERVVKNADYADSVYRHIKLDTDDV